jgi:hypothetical protein
MGEKVMSWNYRVVVENKGTEEEWWSIREVYYNDNDDICAMSEDGAGPIGDGLEELTVDILHMVNALYKDVIIFDDDFVFAPWNFTLKECDDIDLTAEARKIYCKDKEKE